MTQNPKPNYFEQHGDLAELKGCHTLNIPQMTIPARINSLSFVHVVRQYTETSLSVGISTLELDVFM